MNLLHEHIQRAKNYMSREPEQANERAAMWSVILGLESVLHQLTPTLPGGGEENGYGEDQDHKVVPADKCVHWWNLLRVTNAWWPVRETGAPGQSHRIAKVRIACKCGKSWEIGDDTPPSPSEAVQPPPGMYVADGGAEPAFEDDPGIPPTFYPEPARPGCEHAWFISDSVLFEPGPKAGSPWTLQGRCTKCSERQMFILTPDPKEAPNGK